jgi:hypothetical protein
MMEHIVMLSEIGWEVAKRELYDLRRRLGHEPSEEEKHKALEDLGITDFYTRHKLINHRRTKRERLRNLRSSGRIY